MENEIRSILKRVTFPPPHETIRQQRDRLLEMDAQGLLAVKLSLEEQLQQPRAQLAQHCAYDYLFLGAIALNSGEARLACRWLEQAVYAFRRQNDMYNEGLALWLLMLAYGQDRQLVFMEECYQTVITKFRRWASLELEGGENDQRYREIEEVLQKSYETTRHSRQPITVASAVLGDSTAALGFLSIHSFPELIAVQAGPDGALWVENSSEEVCLEVSSFQIGEEAYTVVSVRSGDKRILIPRDRHYGWAKVHGNSMNAATPIPIVEGDLALFYQTNGVAEENAIVIASHPDDHDPDAYQYLIKRWRAGRFLSESTEAYPPIRADHQHRILGVVVAIAKRVRV